MLLAFLFTLGFIVFKLIIGFLNLSIFINQCLVHLFIFDFEFFIWLLELVYFIDVLNFFISQLSNMLSELVDVLISFYFRFVKFGIGNASWKWGFILFIILFVLFDRLTYGVFRLILSFENLWGRNKSIFGKVKWAIGAILHKIPLLLLIVLYIFSIWCQSW